LKERPEELSDKVFETLFEEAEINKLTIEEMRLYIKRYPPENDWNNALDYAKEKVAKNLLDLHFSVNDIAKATGLAPEQILRIHPQ
jgi:hypothetical protein